MLFGRHAQRLEDDALDVLPVNTAGARAQLGAFEHHVVGGKPALTAVEGRVPAVRFSARESVGRGTRQRHARHQRTSNLQFPLRSATAKAQTGSDRFWLDCAFGACLASPPWIAANRAAFSFHFRLPTADRLRGTARLCLCPATHRDQHGADSTSSHEATLKFWNRDIVIPRAKVAGGDPAERASRALDRIEELPLNVNPKEIELHPIKVENRLLGAARCGVAHHAGRGVHWLSYALHRFPYTEPWARQMGGRVIEFFQGLASSAVNALPGIFACAVIFTITRWVVRLGRAFFPAGSEGQGPFLASRSGRGPGNGAYLYLRPVDLCRRCGLSLHPGIEHRCLPRHQCIFRIGGLAGLHRHYQPGHEWTVRGLFPGVEGGRVGGRRGDRRRSAGGGAAGCQGPHHRAPEVTTPNSVLVSHSTRNFTRLGQADGMAVSCRVTIAYDVPWRQVHALLLLAAERTHNLRKHPSPYVLQRALSDFHVEYVLIARLLDEKLRVETLSELHANIQDAFNEFGVQIMLPYMDMNAHNAVVVPPSKWYSPPATQDNGSPTSAIDHLSLPKTQL